MARQYTAWVAQTGRTRDAMFVAGFRTLSSGDASVVAWTEDARKALQFARRSDARNFIEGCDIGARPVEKQFL